MIFVINLNRCHKYLACLLKRSSQVMSFVFIKGGIMKFISKKIKNQTRLTCLALLALTVGHISHAQAVADATLNITGTVTATTCYLKINSATGGTMATMTTPQVAMNATSKAAAPGDSLSVIKQFWLSLSVGSGDSTSCSVGSTFNTIFYAPAGQVVTVGSATYIKNIEIASTATGVAVKVSNGGAPFFIPTTPSGLLFQGGSSNYSPQTFLNAASLSAVQNFQLTIIKTEGAGTDIGPGAIAGTVMVSYAVF